MEENETNEIANFDDMKSSEFFAMLIFVYEIFRNIKSEELGE